MQAHRLSRSMDFLHGSRVAECLTTTDHGFLFKILMEFGLVEKNRLVYNLEPLMR